MRETINKPEEKLMAAIFGEDCPKCYPYIMVENNGEERKIGLDEAIREVLKTLPLRRGKNDPQKWARYERILELRFGLTDGKSRTQREIGQELGGITGATVRQMEARTLRILRHPSRSKYLRQFFIPSPEEIHNLWKVIYRLRDENQSLSENSQRLETILKGCGIKEEKLEGVKPDDLKAFEALMARFPNNRVRNAIGRHSFREPGVIKLSRLKEMVESGEICQVRDIGVKSKAFLKNVFQTIDKEASP